MDASNLSCFSEFDAYREFGIKTITRSDSCYTMWDNSLEHNIDITATMTPEAYAKLSDFIIKSAYEETDVNVSDSEIKYKIKYR